MGLGPGADRNETELVRLGLGKRVSTWAGATVGEGLGRGWDRPGERRADLRGRKGAG